MLRLHTMVGLGGGRFTPALVEISGTANGQAGGNTISNAAIGVASDGRMVVVCFSKDTGGDSVSAVVIGGVAATLAVESASRGGIWYAAVPTGTTASITWDGINDPGYSVFRVTGQSSNTPTDTASVSGTVQQSTTIDIPTNGGAIACLSHSDQGSVITWTGLTEYADVDAGQTRHSSASTTDASGSVDIGATGDNPGGGVALFAASWG